MTAALAREILVVDDDPSIREALEDVLSTEGYRVAVAENGSVAVDRIRRGPRPSLVLLDLMMPVLSGWEFLVLAEQDEVLAAVPVVVISAMTAPLSSEEAPVA